MFPIHWNGFIQFYYLKRINVLIRNQCVCTQSRPIVRFQSWKLDYSNHCESTESGAEKGEVYKGIFCGEVATVIPRDKSLDSSLWHASRMTSVQITRPGCWSPGLQSQDSYQLLLQCGRQRHENPKKLSSQLSWTLLLWTRRPCFKNGWRQGLYSLPLSFPLPFSLPLPTTYLYPPLYTTQPFKKSLTSGVNLIFMNCFDSYNLSGKNPSATYGL